MDDDIVERFMLAHRERREQQKAKKLIDLDDAVARQKSQIESEYERRKARISGDTDHHSFLRQRSDDEYRRNVQAVLAAKESGEPYLLEKWLRFDKWSPAEAFVLMCGFEPSNCKFDDDGQIAAPIEDASLAASGLDLAYHARTLDGFDFDSEACRDILGFDDINRRHVIFRLAYRRLKETWDSGDRVEHRHAPSHFVAWALSKKFHLNWLPWAQEQGYLLEFDSVTTQGDEGDAVEIKTIPNDATDASKHSKSARPADKIVEGKSENAYLSIIGALCDLYWKEKYPDQEKFKLARLLEDLEPYEDFSGLGKTNLKNKIPRALNLIRVE